MDAGFRIGIELEILLTHRKKAKDEFPDLEAFANHLIAHFHAARRPYPRVHNDVDGIYEGSEISAEWSLTDDVTIKPDTDDQYQGRWSSCLPSFNTMREVYDNGRRYFAWNFTNLYYGGKATLEFRQAPGASDETACLPWVEFVASFVNSSKMMSSDRNISRFSRDVQGLRRFLTSFGVSGSNRGILESLFRGKSGYINPSPVRALVTAEQETLKAKEDEGNAKNLVMKKLQSM